MLNDPGAGFTASFESSGRVINGKVKVDSHAYITAQTQDGKVTIDASNKFAQKFTVPSSFTTTRIDVFLARNDGDDNMIDVRILNDSGGLPDTGSIVDSGTITKLGNLRPRWYTIVFPATVALTGGTDYWLELDAVGDTSFFWYKNTSVSGLDYALNDTTLTSDEALIMKIRNINEPSNQFEVPNLVDYNLNINDKYQSSSGVVRVFNANNQYDEDQPLRHIFSKDTEISIWVSNGVHDLRLRTMLVDSFVQKESTQEIRLLGKDSRLIVQELLFKSEYIGQDYGRVVRDLVRQARLVKGDLQYADSGLVADSGLDADAGTGLIDLTGVTFPSSGTLSGKIIDGIKKIEDATNYVFSINNEGIPVFKPRQTTFTPVFTFDQTVHILREQINVNESKKNMFNRVLIDNEQTSDGLPLTLSSATVLSTNTGTILASERSITVTVSYSSTPIVRAVIKDNTNSDDTTLIEQHRSTEEITVKIFNNNYPNSSANYDFEVTGSLVTNDSGSLIVKEKVNPDTINDDALIDLELKNNLFTTESQVNEFIDALVIFNSNPREFFNVSTRGIPTIETNDIVKFSHDKIDSRFIYKVTGQTIVYTNSPRQYMTNYMVEKYPFLEGQSLSTIFLYADDGNVADSGLLADSDVTARQKTYI